MSSAAINEYSYSEEEGEVVEIWTAIAAEAAETPPSCLRGFNYTVVEPDFEDDDEISETVGYDLSCKHCGSDEFQIGGFIVDIEDGKSFFGKTKYETVTAPPHSLKCSGCAHTELLLDPVVHGYEAAMGEESTCHTGDPTEDTQDWTEALTVRFAVTYSDSLENEEELRAEAAQVVKPVTALFDEATIIGFDDEGDVEIEYNHELA